MSNILIVSEKPSVGKAIAGVLKVKETVKHEGYIEGYSEFYGLTVWITWCIGHLVEMYNPDQYDPKYSKWNYEDLPIIPSVFKYRAISGKEKQFQIVAKLMNSVGGSEQDKKELSTLSEDKKFLVPVSSVVCATDAGREGKLIFRLVYEYAQCKKPMERLWISSMEDAAIREGFAHLRPGRDYDRLYGAAVCRAEADWLIGINATRLFSVLYGTTLNVGRVMTPTLALLIRRETEIRDFISSPYYVPEIDCGDFTAAGEKMTEKKDAEKICGECNEKFAVVLEVDKQMKTIQPPRLYDLTTLQRECNRIYGYTAQQTLDYLQSLYEKKLATYPRTDSQFLTNDMQDTAAALVYWMREHLPFGSGCQGEPEIDRVTDSRKVTDHHAIIPTMEIARQELSELPSGEKNVLLLIAMRLLCATGKAYRYEAVRAEIGCAGHTFTAKGKSVLREGWKETERLFRSSLRQKTEEKEKEDIVLPELLKGQLFEPVEAKIREGKTSPPKHYTEDSLLAAMETAGAADMPEDAERKGLGTPATRAAILEKLVSVGFVERKKKQLIPTEKGTNLITVLPEEIKSPLLTAEWEARLKEVEHGELAPEEFIKGIAEMSRCLVETHNAP